jgi:hypothetical protein
MTVKTGHILKLVVYRDCHKGIEVTKIKKTSFFSLCVLGVFVVN